MIIRLQILLSIFSLRPYAAETLFSTLRFGNRAKKMVTRPVCNLVDTGLSSAAAAALRGELEAIKAELVASHVRADDLRAEVALLRLHSPATPAEKRRVVHDCCSGG
mmetsp:Transcript_3664/g.8753  ORF Transcript_3664/g.8753 Transcript_3664/m.8753 type:complete len:107 (+) Transcript_3664:696-1016(+)